MKPKICCFAGHGRIDAYTEDDGVIEKRVYDKCKELITSCGVTQFWAGSYGHFDGLCSKTVRTLQIKYSGITLYKVLPYLTKDFIRYKDLYESKCNGFIMADIPDNTPKRYRIIKCNQFMVDSSDYLISYINYSFGGAYTTFTYANRKKHIKVYNFGSL